MEILFKKVMFLFELHFFSYSIFLKITRIIIINIISALFMTAINRTLSQQLQGQIFDNKYNEMPTGRLDFLFS